MAVQQQKYFANGVIQGNGVVGTRTLADTLYALNSKLVIVTVNGGGSTTTTTPRGNVLMQVDQIGGAPELIIKEVNPSAWFYSYVHPANLYCVVGPEVSTADLQHRIRQIGANADAVRSSVNSFTYANTSIISSAASPGDNSQDISGTVVAEASSILLT